MRSLSIEEERDVAVRAKRAHERMHGQSTWIEAHYNSVFNQVRVNDMELNIITYWNVNIESKRRVAFFKQLGERA